MKTKCDRCGKETDCFIMSMYSTAEICDECKDKETKRADYRQQVEIDDQLYLERLRSMK